MDEQQFEAIMGEFARLNARMDKMAEVVKELQGKGSIYEQLEMQHTQYNRIVGELVVIGGVLSRLEPEYKPVELPDPNKPKTETPTTRTMYKPGEVATDLPLFIRYFCLPFPASPS